MDTPHSSVSDNLYVKNLQDNECAKRVWVQPTVIKISVRKTFQGFGSLEEGVDVFGKTQNQG